MFRSDVRKRAHAAARKEQSGRRDDVGSAQVGDAVLFDVEVHDRDDWEQLATWRVTVPRATLREIMLDFVCDRISLDVNVCAILVERVEGSL